MTPLAEIAVTNSGPNGRLIGVLPRSNQVVELELGSNVSLQGRTFNTTVGETDLINVEKAFLLAL